MATFGHPDSMRAKGTVAFNQDIDHLAAGVILDPSHDPDVLVRRPAGCARYLQRLRILGTSARWRFPPPASSRSPAASIAAHLRLYRGRLAVYRAGSKAVDSIRS